MLAIANGPADIKPSMPSSGTVLDSFVSTYKNAQDTTPTSEEAREILGFIKGGRWKDRIEEIRDLYERTLNAKGHPDVETATKAAGKAVAEMKTRLPSATFSVVSRKRNKNSTAFHTGILCADLDRIEARLPEIRAIIDADPYTLASFLSPTGAGLKVLFRIHRVPKLTWRHSTP